MITPTLAESPARLLWSDRVLAVLERSDDPARQLAAGQLVELFACPSRAARLEAILLDRDRPPWVRTYVLRAMEARGVELRADAVAGLGEELACQLADSSSSSFACLDNLLTLLQLAPNGADIVRRLEARAARRLLCHAHHSGRRLADPIAAIAYELAGPLDDELAWATLEQSASQAFVLDRGSLDLTRLRTALRAWTVDAILALFRERDRSLQLAIEGLALPVAVLTACATTGDLVAIARRHLHAAATARERTAAIALLAQLPDAVPTLDRLRDDDSIDPDARRRAQLARMRLPPWPGPDSFPAYDLTTYVLEGRALPRDILAWAASSPSVPIRCAGILGSIELGIDPGHIDTSDHPLLAVLASRWAAHLGDPEAIEALLGAARDSEHVVVRAAALRGLRDAHRRPPSYAATCIEALRADGASFDMYYQPATCEAALCLARHPELDEDASLAELVNGVLGSKNDDTWWALRTSILSWLDHTEPRLQPVWTSIYLKQLSTVTAG